MTREQQSKVIVIEDQKEIQLSVRFLLRNYFDQIDIFDHPQKAISVLTDEDVDVILLDMNFSKGMHQGEEGIEWMKKIHHQRPDSVVVLMTAFADVELAIRSIKNGAFDFIMKPWDNEKFITTIQAAHRYSLIRRKSHEGSSKNFVVGKSAAFKEAIRKAEKVANTEANVLLLGENGTGKELMAEFIHQHSSRSQNPFIKVDLGSISENLFESELFGHAKGAFTDAKEHRIGWFEQANSGTLFLDEIGNLNVNLQAKLLSAIQNSCITRVGSTRKIALDIRIICATNADLNLMVQNGSFRKDLLYRINTVSISLPPLKDRGEDIIELSQHFLNDFSLKYRRRLLNLSDIAIQSILNYSWPGNIRELQHSIERAVILCEGPEIQPEDLIVAQSGAEDETKGHLMNLEEIEMQTIRKALMKHSGVITRAAHELGLTRASLYRRLQKYGL